MTTIRMTTLRDAINAHLESTGSYADTPFVTTKVTFPDNGEDCTIDECEFEPDDTMKVKSLAYYRLFVHGTPAGLELRGNCGDVSILVVMRRIWNEDERELCPTAIATTLMRLGLPVYDDYTEYGEAIHDEGLVRKK
jgi:hypothetical protein